MISLLDRLKPEYSEELGRVNLKYPDIIASISNDLEQESLIHNLIYSTIYIFFGDKCAIKAIIHKNHILVLYKYKNTYKAPNIS